MVAPHPYPKISACIFDMDGLLLNTEDLYSQISNAILAPFGKFITKEVKSKMMGREVKAATDVLISGMGLPFTFDEYNDMASEMKFKVFPFADLTPGAAKLIKHLVKHNIPIAIATSSTRHMFEIKTARNQHIFELFGENVTCGDDPNLKQSKPDPSIFLLARSRLPNPPPHEECLVFEDSNNGVCAAKRAGMNAVWVPDSRFTVQQEIDENEFNAVQVLSSLEEFDPALYGLPSYDD